MNYQVVKNKSIIVRILLTDPEIIIFDESVSALDMNTQTCFKSYKKIYYKNNIIIIYISRYKYSFFYVIKFMF